MSISRQHFEAIASSLNKTVPDFNDDHLVKNAHKDVCLNVAYALKGFNSRFDFQKFMEACGYNYNPSGAFYYIGQK